MLRMSEVNQVDPQAMQHMLTTDAIDWEGFSGQIARETDALLGGMESVLIVDESGFSKKGEASAGVARQWNGRLGKVDNCQVGVFAALCHQDMSSLVDARLYLPAHWAADSERCTRAAIPKDAQVYQSKCDLALGMVQKSLERGVRFGHLAVDGGYGKDPAFLRAVDALNCCFVADVHSNQRLYLQDPHPQLPVRKGHGKLPLRLQAQTASIRVDQWARQQAADAWQRLTLREGEKGLLTAEYLHTLMWVWDGKETTARRWHLLVRREVGADSISHYCLSNAPLDTPFQTLARVQAQRFFIEHSFREAKSECGLADYQARRWDAWHHHMALVMLATLFLLKQKCLGRQQWPMLSLNDLVTALTHLLPRRQLTAQELAGIIEDRHRLRRKAKESHAKQSRKRLE